MKTTRLANYPDTPWRDKDGHVCLVKSPVVRLLNPYTVVAAWALHVKGGKVHIASWVEHDGVVDISPMSICGKNSGARPLNAQLVKGPVRIDCKQCTTFALLDLARLGKLPGCDHA